jgi:hypothetical protein
LRTPSMKMRMMWKPYRRLRERGEHEGGAAHVQEGPADPERVTPYHLHAARRGMVKRQRRRMAIRERTAEGGRGKGEGHPDLELEGEGREDERALLSDPVRRTPGARVRNIFFFDIRVRNILGAGEGGDHEGRR